MKITVAGCGRWGTFIAGYLSALGHNVTLYGRNGSSNFLKLKEERKNDYMSLPDSLSLSSDLSDFSEAEVIVVSIPVQNLEGFMRTLSPLGLKNKSFVLCMKGIEIGSGRRPSQIVRENTDSSNRIAVWIGPGHVQEFCRGVPNCMVIDSDDEALKDTLIKAFSGELIRFYYGQDIIGNEIGAAAKNVIGIAAGMLDGAELSTLKGALMSRGTMEVSRLISAMGGKSISAYGLCHLGDYEATVFSQFSHNRKFGEKFILGESFDKLSEGYFTVKALMELSEKYGVELPISKAVYDILYSGADPHVTLNSLFTRALKSEF